jgi:uncharacterized membrane protein (UPF0127 family)
LISSGQVQACPVANEHILITVNGHALTAELAANGASHVCGLAFRDSLPADRGMLFVYPRDQILSFWMKNTFIPLSIAFLDSAGNILEIHSMDPSNPTRRFNSKSPARYALEVNKGWFSEKKIQVYDRVEFDLPDGS